MANIRIVIPESSKHITLEELSGFFSKYARVEPVRPNELSEAEEANDDTYFQYLEDLAKYARDKFKWWIDVIAYFSKQPKSVIQALPQSATERCINIIEALLNEIRSFYDSAAARTPLGHFEHLGVRYIVPENVRELKTGQVGVAMTYNAEFAKVINGNFDALRGLIACVCNREDEGTKALSDREIDQRAELFKTLPANIALEVAFFLSKKSERLHSYILLHSAAQAVADARYLAKTRKGSAGATASRKR